MNSDHFQTKEQKSAQDKYQDELRRQVSLDIISNVYFAPIKCAKLWYFK